ncbi:MAG: ribosome-associated translation inhibitor RaiA, partial [Proteobacteria bacterium]|nr:ribosome-associated translation inhibitor RaiA [Pseudomonadota bacterium]
MTIKSRLNTEGENLMEMQFYFKDMRSSDSLRNYAEGKLREKVNKLATKPVIAHVTFSLQLPKKKVHVHFHNGIGGSMEIEVLDDDMYAAIDKLIDKFDGQLRRKKELLKGHRNIFARALKFRELFIGPYSRLTGLATKGLPDQNKKDEVDASIDASEVIKLETARRHLFH